MELPRRLALWTKVRLPTKIWTVRKSTGKGSINIFRTCSIKSGRQMGEKGGNYIRDTKIKHLL